MVEWPSKIDRQMEQVAELQAKDEDRFQKNLVSDQQAFSDKIDALEVRHTCQPCTCMRGHSVGELSFKRA